MSVSDVLWTNVDAGGTMRDGDLQHCRLQMSADTHVAGHVWRRPVPKRIREFMWR